MSTRYGPYEVLGELGRGGMGLVYRARTADGRQVALKVILRGRASGPAMERFARERRLLTSFSMADGFVPLLDAGDGPTGPYLVMPLVTGGTLRQRLRPATPDASASLSTSSTVDAGTPLAIDEAVSIARQMAAAVGLAHRRGIVHRDLKPENVLFTDDGRPLVSDLGLAKHFSADATGASQTVALTQAGESRGTIGYMAPEQINDSKSVGPPADVFALGAILYECVAGRAPFAADSPHGVLARVSLGEYEPLRRVRTDCPAWLAGVVDRALARRPEDRPQDGIELAAELDAGLPQRRARGLLAGVALAGVAAAAAGAALALRPRATGDVAPEPSATQAAAPSGAPTTRGSPTATGPRAIPAVCAPLARTKRTRLLSLCGDLSFKHDGPCRALALASDGRLYSAGDDGPLVVWDLQAALRGERPVAELQALLWHERPVLSIALSPDGGRALTGCPDDGTVGLWDLAEGKLLRTLRGEKVGTWGCGWAPDGIHVVTSGRERTVCVWDVSTDRVEVARHERHEGEVAWCAFAQDGRVVSVSDDGSVLLWDWKGGTEPKRLAGHEKPIRAASLLRGERLLTASEDGTLRVWDLRAGAEVRALRGHGGPAGLRSCAASADGRRALSGGRWDDPTLRLWDLERGEALRTLRGHADEVFACALLPDGRHAVSGSSDGSIRAWDLETGAEVGAPDGHRGPVLALAYTPDGARLWSSGDDRTCRLWDVATGREVGPRIDAGEPVVALRLSPDGRRLLTGGRYGGVRLWDTARGEAVQTFPGPEGEVRGVALSADGRAALTFGEDRKVRLWGVAGGTIEETFVREDPGRMAAFLPDGQRALDLDHRGGMRVWDLRTRAELDRYAGSFTSEAAISADGAFVYVAVPQGPSPTIVFDLGKKDPFPRPLPGSSSEALGVSPDGRILVGVEDRRVEVWDPRASGARIDGFDLAALRDRARCAAVAPGGRTFAVGTARGVVLVFELR